MQLFRKGCRIDLKDPELCGLGTWVEGGCPGTKGTVAEAWRGGHSALTKSAEEDTLTPGTAQCPRRVRKRNP